MSLFILFSAANNTVAAPSLKLLALAAVIVPSLLKEGLNFKILFLSNFKGSSSLLTVIDPFLDLTSTLQISLSKQPKLIALLDLSYDCIAYLSCCSLVYYFSSHNFSAQYPIKKSLYGSRKPS